MMEGSQNDSFINNIIKQDNSKGNKMSPHSNDIEMSREISKERKLSSSPRDRGIDLKDIRAIDQTNQLWT